MVHEQIALPTLENSGDQTQRVDQKLIDVMVATVSHAKPHAEWFQSHATLDIHDVVIKRPYECTITGTLNRALGEDQAEISIDIFHVNEVLQKKGIGTRLLQALTTQAVKYGAKKLFGHMTSLSALKTGAKVFGKDNLVFYSYNPLTKERKPIGITFEQAWEQSQKENKVDYGVAVDLTKVNVTD